MRLRFSLFSPLVLTVLYILTWAVALGTAFGQAVDDFSIKGRWGYSVEETVYDKFGVVFTNSGTSAKTVTCKPNLTVYTVVSPLSSGGYFLATTSTVAYTGSVPPGAYRWVPLYVRVKSVSNPDIGRHGIGATVNFIMDGTTYNKKFLERNVNFIGQLTSPTTNDFINVAAKYAAVNVPLLTNSAVNSGTACCVGYIDLAAPNDVGKFTIHGVPGTVKIELKYNAVSKGIWIYNHDGETVISPNPDQVYTSPDAYADIGQQWQVYLNGQLVKTGIIAPTDVLLGNGYDILLNWSPDWNYPATIPAGEDVTMPISDGITRPDDTGHVRPDPAPIPGTDPAGDNTVDSDGAGPGTGLSVKDIYRGVRAAVEDALDTPDGSSFSFQKWDAGEKLGDNAQGSGFGNAVKGGLGDLTGAAGAGSTPMNVPGLTGGSGLVVAIAGYGLTIPPVPGASAIRILFLLFLLIYVFRASFSIVRGGFASAT